MYAGVGGANTTSFLLAAHFAKRNTKSGGGGKIGIGKRERAKIPFPRPPFYPSVVLTKEGLFARPSVQFLPREARHHSGFRSKKVRAAFSNCDRYKKY